MAGKINCDTIWTGADLVTMRDGRYNLIEDGAIAVERGNIVWLGPCADAAEIQAREHHDFGGGIITPGLIDCHTHLVFGGDRSHEFEQRLNGVSYAEIAAQGGGIISTVRATREASLEQLVSSARWRIERLLAEGVTTLEIKSGYGLDEESELRIMQAIRQIGKLIPADVFSTCLAAHATPPEFKHNPDGWI